MHRLLAKPALPWELQPDDHDDGASYGLEIAAGPNAEHAHLWLNPDLDHLYLGFTAEPAVVDMNAPLPSPVFEDVPHPAGAPRDVIFPPRTISPPVAKPKPVKEDKPVKKLRPAAKIKKPCRLWVCAEQLCIYSSGRKGNYERHVRNTHTKERPFKCNVCNYASADPGAVTRHMRQHTGEAPAICKYAGCRCTYTSNPPFACK
jgi:hypothetical protein